jgi:hypothetical protein
VEKEKEKRSLLCWAGGRVFGPPRARARARARLRPSGGPRAEGRRRECARVTASLRAHSSARAEGGNGVAARRRGRTGRAREKGRWARRRFAAGGPVLGPREGGLAWAEAGDSKGRLNSARGGWEGAVHGEVAEFRSGDRRRWALGEGLGLGSGASGSWPREGAAWLT